MLYFLKRTRITVYSNREALKMFERQLELEKIYSSKTNYLLDMVLLDKNGKVVKEYKRNEC